MPRSSGKEDSFNSSSRKTIIKNSLNLFFSKIFIFRYLFSKLSSKEKIADDFHGAIKELKYNSKKMTPEEKKIFMNLLKFGNKTVEDVMIPRSDIKAVKLTTNFDELSQILSTKIPNTRTLVYDETLDNIVGFIHVKDLCTAFFSGIE